MCRLLLEGGDLGWFADAERVGLGAQLEQVTILRALRGLERLPEDCYLSVTAVDDCEALRTGLRPFRNAGMRLAIDDVGSGFASLRHVLRLTPDIIKIDRSLVHEVTTDPAQHAIAIALAELGRRVGTTIVAEGVEDRTTLDMLKEAGITHAQGWLFDRPGPLPLEHTSYTFDQPPGTNPGG